jgi:hypothetical protein
VIVVAELVDSVHVASLWFFMVIGLAAEPLASEALGPNVGWLVIAVPLELSIPVNVISPSLLI